MRVEYYLLDPTGNKTILVDSPVPVSEQPGIASRLMEIEPETEQVGFLSKDEDCDLSLRMAGGEFCGNASMSTAVITALKKGAGSGSFRLKVSGAAEPVSAEVRLRSDGRWDGTVKMPCPVSVEKIRFPGEDVDFPVVRFEGISHVILETAVDREMAEQKAPSWCRFLCADAVGLMFLDRDASSLTPLVYVPAANTLFWENSCASGTTAAGAFLAEESGVPLTVTLKQPGGFLKVNVTAEQQFYLSGTVRVCKHIETNITKP